MHFWERLDIDTDLPMLCVQEMYRNNPAIDIQLATIVNTIIGANPYPLNNPGYESIPLPIAVFNRFIYPGIIAFI